MNLLKLDRLAVIADTHWGSGDAGDAFLKNAGLFVKFCEWCEKEERTLCIAGDVWELLVYGWPEIVARHALAFRSLRKLAEQNLLLLIMGNHDQGAGVLAGIIPRVCFFSVDVETGGKIVHIEHGHRFDKLTSHPNWLQTWASQVGNWVKRTSFLEQEQRRFRRLDELLKESAGRLLAQKEYDAVIFGHSHTLAQESYATKHGTRYYYNPGTWNESLPHSVMVTEGRLELCPVIARKEVEV